MSGINLFPNPTEGKFIVSVDFSGTKIIRVVNSLGMLILEQESFEKNETIDLSSFNKGVYFVKISTAQGELISKVIHN